MKKDILTVCGLFLIIIFVTMWFSSTPSYIPYSATIFSSQAKFEGFSTKNVLEYTSTSNNTALESPVSNYLITPTYSGPKILSGFEGVGVFNSPEVATKEKLDIYSQATGSIDADGFGYYNSRGSLVLDSNMKNMLQTRGGNTTGCASSIGGSPV
jgi:hypothetical protein